MADDRPARVLQMPEPSAKDAGVASLVESHGARIGDCEGQIAALKAQVRAIAFSVDEGLDATKSRLGQIRNVEQRCRKLWEQMRLLHQEVTLRYKR